MRGAVSFAAALLLAAVAGAQARADTWTASTAVTAVELDPGLLAAVGLAANARGGSPPERFRGARFHSVPPSRLEFRAPGGDFERFDRGLLVHDGGFVLEGAAGRVHLDPLILRVSEGSDDFDWLDAGGRRWFVLRDMQFSASFGSQELRLQNVSIHVAPELAAFLGDERLAWAFVGEANVVLPALIAPETAGGGAGDPCVESEGEIDVALTQIAQVSQVARQAGVRVALAPSAKLENVGVGSVEWYESIAPPEHGGVGPHPYLSLSMFRLDPDGSLVQLGLGDVKHAFYSVNTDCICPGGHILYPGCTDTYGVTTNRDRDYLAPREGVTASTGAWTRVGSHFDRCLHPATGCNPASDDTDDFRDHFGDAPAGVHHDDFEHRLTVPESGLEVAGARYFVDAWYVTKDDVDLFNGMGRREVDPSLAGGLWTFPFVDAGLTSGSLLDELSADLLTTLETGEGTLQLAVRVSDLGGGVSHFEYALMNFDFDRQVDRFEVPVPPGALVANVDSRGLGDDPANDWTPTVGATGVAWQAPAGSGLDWGMLVSFGFDVDAAPVPGAAGARVREAGSPGELAFPTLVAPEPGALFLGGCAMLVVALLRRRQRLA